jgi:hypothetical protein
MDLQGKKRLVAGENSQITGINFNESIAPVINDASFESC